MYCIGSFGNSYANSDDIPCLGNPRKSIILRTIGWDTQMMMDLCGFPKNCHQNLHINVRNSLYKAPTKKASNEFWINSGISALKVFPHLFFRVLFASFFLSTPTPPLPPKLIFLVEEGECGGAGFWGGIWTGSPHSKKGISFKMARERTRERANRALVIVLSSGQFWGSEMPSEIVFWRPQNRSQLKP